MSYCLALTDVDWSLTKDVLGVVGTFVGAIISAAAVLVAYKFGNEGLNTWKRQLRGTTDHELAKRVLIELYRYKSSMERARSPFMFGYEMQLDPDEGEGLGFSAKRHLGRRKGYQRRLDLVAEARAPIESSLIEAEAIWGVELRKLFQPLFSLQHEFYIYVDYHFVSTDPTEDDDYRKSYGEILKNKRDVLFDATDEIGDDFRKEFNLAVEDIQQYVKPKLA
ncbi:hypothetical protein PflCFBP13510_12255 [Pseudomonas fluorescens]|nr:hypothetical protein PflCFBP13510_12255 [Pseudomonas fluorescens]